MTNSRNFDIAHWAARLVTVGILAMGSLPKFTGGSAALADKLPGGATSVLIIGAVEVIAIVLILVPRTTMIGSAVAAVVMLGAVASHVVGPVGMEGDMGTMFFMALIAALSALAATWMAWKKRTTAMVTSAA